MLMCSRRVPTSEPPPGRGALFLCGTGSHSRLPACYAALLLEGDPMLKPTLSAIAALLAFGLGTTTARAQPTRVFVAAQGSDANPCTFASPCRTFQHAHNVVA